MRIACAAVALCLLLCSPAVAQVGNGLTLGETQTQTDAAAPPDTSTSGGGGLKTWQEALIFGAGIVLLGGIAAAILGDARERARRLDRHAATGASATDTADRHKTSQQAKQQARARARRAKAARKRNR
ncbi:MAG: hypothetical protein ABI950_06690 [Solirubrobacteraceae bacterium]